MTEERMICVRKKTSRLVLDYESGTMEKETQWTGWTPIEKAPPKDWKPDCYYSDRHIQLNSDCCEQCPWKSRK